MICIDAYDKAERLVSAKEYTDELWDLVPKCAFNMYYDYIASKEMGLEKLNIRHLENIPNTAQELRRLGIQTFTTTDSMSNLLYRLFELADCGIQIVGLWKVCTHPVDENKKPEELAGLLLTVR